MFIYCLSTNLNSLTIDRVFCNTIGLCFFTYELSLSIEQFGIHLNALYFCYRDKSRNLARITCTVCLEDYQTTINFLSEPIDVYNDWVDACENANWTSYRLMYISAGFRALEKSQFLFTRNRRLVHKSCLCLKYVVCSNSVSTGQPLRKLIM